jgi:predicted transcriptional regulator
MNTPVSLRLGAELRSGLEKIAKAENRSISYVAQEAISQYVDAKTWMHEQILEAYEASLTETEFISGDAVMKWVNSWGTESELPVPKPDIFLDK